MLFALGRLTGVVAFAGFAAGGYAVDQYLGAFFGGTLAPSDGGVSP